jgi:DNA (cytosine-5)-methyltransferase 1
MRPKLLDLFSGAGGCTKGYQRAGFWVRGVDIKPQPRYCGDEFVQADALEFLAAEMLSGRIMDFDAIHASPPCQGYSENMKHLSNGSAPLLIEPCRGLLNSIDLPWVIENVEGAPLETASNLFGDHGVTLCGVQFGLRIWRHRLFESSFPIQAPPPCRHTNKPLNPHREESRKAMRAEFGKVDLEKIWREAAGVPWMNKAEGRQAVPPAYTEFIGKQLREVIK